MRVCCRFVVISYNSSVNWYCATIIRVRSGWIMKRSFVVRLGWVWVTGAVGMVGLGREIPTRVHLCVGEFIKRRLTTSQWVSASGKLIDSSTGSSSSVGASVTVSQIASRTSATVTAELGTPVDSVESSDRQTDRQTLITGRARSINASSHLCHLHLLRLLLLLVDSRMYGHGNTALKGNQRCVRTLYSAFVADRAPDINNITNLY